jgi:DNA-binding response OmpR family regulator
MDRARILIVDDDPNFVEFVETVLLDAGYESLIAYSAGEALHQLARRPALMLLDINLAGRDGFDLLPEVRARSGIPVVMLTGRTAEDDLVRALYLGADDYLTKPFSPWDLLARIRVCLRRAEAPAPVAGTTGPLTAGPVMLDPAERWLWVAGRSMRLTKTELAFMTCLLRHRGAVVPYRDLARWVWGDDEDPLIEERVRAALHRVRHKLAGGQVEGTLIETIPGTGLILRAEAA